MFTGIIQNQGEIAARTEAGHQVHFSIRLRKPDPRPISLGESIAVNGVCLTVVRFKGRNFEVDVIKETLKATALSSLKKGSAVNLERALRMGEPFGGHFVTGHVDGVGRVKVIEKQGKNRSYWIEAPAEVMRYIAPKGSISIDGISLTVQKRKLTSFMVSIIPHTFRETNFSKLEENNKVNLEVDLIARYLNMFSEVFPKNTGRLSLAGLKKQGF